MLKWAVELIGGWLGITDAGVLAIAEGVALGIGVSIVVFFALYLALMIVFGVIARLING